jgi:hypothetical protein
LADIIIDELVELRFFKDFTDQLLSALAMHVDVLELGRGLFERLAVTVADAFEKLDLLGRQGIVSQQAAVVLKSVPEELQSTINLNFHGLLALFTPLPHTIELAYAVRHQFTELLGLLSPVRPLEVHHLLALILAGPLHGSDSIAN